MRERVGARRATTDDGFTLVELLIVIVILGILATVTVFAVRGITDDGQTAACGTEFRQIHTAQEIHRAQHGTYASEADLVSTGTLASDSQLFDTTLSGTGYDIVPVATQCSQTATAVGAAAPPPLVIPAENPPVTRAEFRTASIGAVNGLPQWGLRSADPNGNAEILVFGRGTADVDWNAMIASNVPSNRRVTFIDIDALGTMPRLQSVLTAVNSNPPTTYVIYPADDNIAFGPHADLRTALLDEFGANPTWTGTITDLDGATSTLTEHLLDLL